MANTDYYSLLVRDQGVVLAAVNPSDKEENCLSLLDGAVVVARVNSDDVRQQWHKANFVNDEEGRPSFALVNKAAGKAIKIFNDFITKILPISFDPANVDESCLWKEEIGKGGFGTIVPSKNTRPNFVLLSDGTPVTLGGRACGNEDSQSWKMTPWVKLDDEVVPRFRIYCKAYEGLSATVREGVVVLEETNPHDERQHWIKDTRRVRDEEGNRAFILLNNYTGEAIKHSHGEGLPVRLEYNPKSLDKSVMWTESSDVGGGFKHVRMVNDTCLSFSVDGPIVILSKDARSNSGEESNHPVKPHYCYLCVLERLRRHSAPKQTHECIMKRLAESQMI